jgi:hypothetical protein
MGSQNAWGSRDDSDPAISVHEFAIWYLSEREAMENSTD